MGTRHWESVDSVRLWEAVLAEADNRIESLPRAPEGTSILC
jgi:hypothetical protein